MEGVTSFHPHFFFSGFQFDGVLVAFLFGVCVCVCAPELDHWLCYSILCLTAASAPRLTKWIFLFFFFLLKPRLLLWFNAWEHLCQGLNYSHAEAESKIRTETHWPFFFFSFSKEARSITWDTFSSSHTHRHSLVWKQASFSFHVSWEKHVRSHVRDQCCAPLSRWLFPEWDHPLCLPHQTHSELHLKPVILISCSCIGSSLFTLLWCNWLCCSYLSWGRRCGARSAESPAGAGGYGGW